MTRPPKRPVSGEYKVGYGKPPSHTRFRAGKSGNPGGRPRGISAARANKLALREAYRIITVRDGDNTVTLPAIQAVMRQLTRLAIKGNGPAQRTIIGIVQGIEQEAAAKAAEEPQTLQVTDQDRARALAAFIQRTRPAT